MENAFIVNGGKKLKGTVVLSGAKNVALKVIIAALMFKGEVRLKNIPRIRDVFELLHLIKLMGGQADFVDDNTVVVNGQNLKTEKVDLLHASKIRVSFMMFAPLLHKFHKALIPNPGGCRLGARSIDRVIEGMKKLGMRVDYDSSTGYYQALMDEFPKGSYIFNKPSHTGTELLIMLSALGNSQVVLEKAALEPEIDDLISFLNEAGAKIERKKETIIIHGVSELEQKTPFTIESDRNEAVTYAVMALATKGEIVLSPIREELIKTFINKLKEIGAGVEKINDLTWRFFYVNNLKSTKVETAPHPGFMTDWQPPWAVLMTQAQGDSIVTERLFENRFAYVEELRKLGAEIDYIKLIGVNPLEYFYFNFDPNKKYNQTIKIKGTEKLHGGVLNIADLRAGATLVIGALVAQGESVISGIENLERGYENFVEKVQRLGGEIKKV